MFPWALGTRVSPPPEACWHPWLDAPHRASLGVISFRSPPPLPRDDRVAMSTLTVVMPPPRAPPASELLGAGTALGGGKSGSRAGSTFVQNQCEEPRSFYGFQQGPPSQLRAQLQVCRTVGTGPRSTHLL